MRLVREEINVEYYIFRLRNVGTYYKLKHRLQKYSSTSFIYRGQSESKWGLVPTLEREIYKKKGKKFFRSFLSRSIKQSYEDLIADKYSGDIAEFLDVNSPKISDMHAFLQHYGSPTRLLDFTKNLEIALFFAIKDLKDKPAVIWMMNLTPLLIGTGIEIEVNEQKLPINNQNDLFERATWGKIDEDGVFVLSEINEKINNRLFSQKGLFLYPINFKKTFQENLFKLPRSEDLDINIINKDPKYIGIQKFKEIQREDHIKTLRVFKVIIPKKFHGEMLKNLEETNVNYKSLFPDEEGLIKTINQELKFLNLQ